MCTDQLTWPVVLGAPFPRRCAHPSSRSHPQRRPWQDKWKFPELSVFLKYCALKTHQALGNNRSSLFLSALTCSQIWQKRIRGARRFHAPLECKHLRGDRTWKEGSYILFCFDKWDLSASSHFSKRYSKSATTVRLEIPSTFRLVILKRRSFLIHVCQSYLLVSGGGLPYRDILDHFSVPMYLKQ